MRKSNNDSVQTVKRSYRRFIVGLTALAVSATICAQDFTRLSERTIMGTARYVGMAGAMSAIGGDPSAVRDNPAGLGLYRRTEVLVSLDYADIFTLAQGSWVLSIPMNTTSVKGLQYHNIMFSYHRLHSYEREWKLVTEGRDISLGSILPPLEIPYCNEQYNSYNDMILREYGMVHEFDLSWGANFADKWYFGAGLHIQNYNFSSSGDYLEKFDYYSLDKQQWSNQNVTSLIMTGASCNASLGVIYRPLMWLRLGFGIETPSFGSINSFTEGKFSAQTDTLSDAPIYTTRSTVKSYHQPFRTTFSTTFQVGAYGLFALQYDYAHAPYMNDLHTMKIGIEAIPILGLYLNLGYVYESTFKPYKAVSMDPSFQRQDTYSLALRASQYASVGFGYRGQYMIVQAAYQFHWRQNAFFTHEKATPYDVYQDTHRVVLTLGWHRD